jgi:hypothetical protein
MTRGGRAGLPAGHDIRAAPTAAAATEKPIRVVQDGRLVGSSIAPASSDIAGGEDDTEPRAGGNGAGPADGLAYLEPPPKVEAVNEPTQETAEFLVETGNPAEPGTQT